MGIYCLATLLLVVCANGAAYFIDQCVKWMNKKNAKYFAISKKCWFVARYTDLRPNLVSRWSLGFQIWNWISAIAYFVLALIAHNEDQYDAANNCLVLGTLSRVLVAVFFSLILIYCIIMAISMGIGSASSPHDIDRMSKF